MITSNMKAPDKQTCLNWVKEAWSSITTKVVQSFQKAEELAAEAAAEIAGQTSMLEMPNDLDPFADLDADDEKRTRKGYGILNSSLMRTGQRKDYPALFH